jgi:hypothetical protein
MKIYTENFINDLRINYYEEKLKNNKVDFADDKYYKQAWFKELQNNRRDNVDEIMTWFQECCEKNKDDVNQWLESYIDEILFLREKATKSKGDDLLAATDGILQLYIVHMLCFNYQIPIVNLVEKYLIGDKHMRKVYGPYVLGADSALPKEQLTYKALYDELNIRIGIQSPEQYIHRNQNSAGKEQLGLIARLKRLGIDIDKYSNQLDKFKLLYFFAWFEAKNNVKLRSFLGNPTLENVDNSLVNDKTKNGELMVELKKNIEKELSKEYIIECKLCLGNIAKEWTDNMLYTRRFIAAWEGKYDLIRINYYLDTILDCNTIKSVDEVYEGTLFQLVYLKLLQHEQLGRENDLADLDKYLEKYSFASGLYGQLEEAYIEKCNVQEYAAKHYDEIAKCVYCKVGSNERKKIKKLSEYLNAFVAAINENTRDWQLAYISADIFIAYYQVLINIDKTDGVVNAFYRYAQSDEKSLYNEAKNLKSAFRKNVLAFIKIVYYQSHKNRGLEAEYKLVLAIERKIDNIIRWICGFNSLSAMKRVNNCYLFVYELLSDSFYDMTNIRQKMEDKIGNGYTIQGDDTCVHMFLALMKSFFDEWVNIIRSQLGNCKEDVINDKEIYTFGETGSESICTIEYSLDKRNKTFTIEGIRVY